MKKTKRLAIAEARFDAQVLGGSCPAALYSAVEVDRLGPLLAGSALVIFPAPRVAILQHIAIFDDMRGSGLGIELLEWVIKQHGPIGAMWCTPSGVGLARAYERIHGRVEAWEIGVEPDMKALCDAAGIKGGEKIAVK